MDYDIIIIGSGPGGYVAAIRAAQLGMKVGVVERESLGGVCLNWGCIPTKALLKSAQVLEYINHAGDYGIQLKGEATPDFAGMVKRSREVAGKMSKGVQYLFKKNKVGVLKGTGRISGKGKVEVEDQDGKKTEYKCGSIIIATGARSRELPNLKQDGEKIIGYRKAMSLDKLPESMLVLGSGAIGSEFAYFYQALGARVTLVEYLPNVVPLEDEEVSSQLERSFKKSGMKIYTGSTVESVDTKNGKCKSVVSTPKGKETVETDIVLSAVGITPNTEGAGLEEAGVELKDGRIRVDEFMKTSVDDIYAIGDVVPGPALAHKASAEGILCVEKLAGLDPSPVRYDNIPACTYTSPEIASVGMTEKQAREAGYEIRVGKFPYTASGKANAAGQKEGFVKMIYDAGYGELLGAHMIGANVTEMIAEAVVARNLETTGHEMIKSVHPHPTMSEAIMEASAAAFGEVIHL